MKKFHKRKKALGLAVSISTALLCNSLVIGQAVEDRVESTDNGEIVVSNNVRAATGEGTYITIDVLNVRSGPGTQYKIEGSLKKGTSINVISVSNGWAKVTYEGKIAYCSATYLEKQSTIKKEVTADTLNVRKTPSASGVYVGSLKKGELIEVKKVTNGWAEIDYKGSTAYCNDSYLKEVKESIENISSSSSQVNTATTTEHVYIRSTASWSGDKLLTVPKGDTVKVLSKGSEWTKVEYSKKTGYILNQYLKFSSTSTGTATNANTGTGQANTATTTEHVYIRSTASWNGDKLLTVPKGDTVKVLSKGSEWTKVEYSKKTGYILNQYLKFSANITNEEVNPEVEKTTKYEVTTSSLNVRSGAGTSYNILGSVKSGEVLEVYSISNGWAKIKFKTSVAYVSASYLKEYKENTSGSINNGSANNSNKIVYLDAGHGGKDPGAIGTTYSTLEKQAALDVVLKLTQKLQSKGYVVKNSRTTDVYIPLSQRSAGANNAKASIFVSIHFNSAATSSALGIETLYKVDKRTSNVLADKVQSQLIAKTGLKSRGLKQRSDLAVLNGTTMPAILVEGGFLSNASDENSIRNAAFREKLADAILAGIEAYYNVNR